MANLEQRIVALELEAHILSPDDKAVQVWLESLSVQQLYALIAYLEVSETLGKAVAMSEMNDRELALVTFHSELGTELDLSNEELAVLEVKMKGLLCP